MGKTKDSGNNKKLIDTKKNNTSKDSGINPKDLTPTRIKFIKFYKEEYLNHINNKSIKNYVDDSKNDVNYLYGSSYNRIHAFLVFGYYMLIDTVDTITVTFKIKDIKTNVETIFAFGYYEELNSKTNIRDSFLEHDNNTLLRYFSIGGSYISKDGEYRSNIISGNNIREIYNIISLKNMEMEIIEYLKDKLTTRKMIIIKDYFFPTDEKKLLIENGMEYGSYRIEFTIFSLSWLVLMINVDLNIVENNLNAKYQEIMLKYKDEDLVFYQSLKKKYSSDDMTKMRFLINHIGIKDLASKRVDITKIGQKIIPLSIAEAQNPFNIRYKPWREYLISLHLSDLVINYISPGFFIINQWYYIKNSRKGLFDNDIQYEKMERSELAEQITNLLNRADIYTHENINKPQNTSKNINKTIDSWISNKFKKLSKKIQDPIDYAKEEIIMSNVALGFFSEYVGRTFMDFITLCKTSAYYNKLVGDPFTLNGYPIFAKYMFDICYNLLCMNNISGIIHGDLHLNNATIKAYLYEDVRNIKDIKNPKVLYILGKKENDQYLFSTVAYNSCIIDFSRSIILPGKINQLHDQSLPKSYIFINKLDEFQDDQVERLLQLYISYTSDSSNNKDDLRIIFRNKFESVFKLLSVTDLIGFTNKLLALFSIDDKDIIKPHKSCIELIKKINSCSETFITLEMNKLISNPNYESIINDMDWPIYTIIQKCFYNFIIDNDTDVGNITDIFNINNELKYSLTKYDKFHPRIKDETNPNLAIDRLAYEKQKENGLKIVNYIATRQREKHI